MKKNKSTVSKVFNQRQKYNIYFWTLISVVLGHFLISNQCVKIEKTFDIFFTSSISLVILAFVSIPYLIISGEIMKKLQETNAYYSLISNFYWIVSLLFFNWVIGWVFWFFGLHKYQNIYIDLMLIADMSLLSLLIWYAISRTMRVIRSGYKL